MIYQRVQLSPLALERGIRPQRRDVQGKIISEIENCWIVQWDNNTRSSIYKAYVIPVEETPAP